MSTIRATNNVGIYKIQKFLGLNEAPDGDSLLKLGEASECKNWKVTRDFNLKRRPGTHTMFTLSEDAPIRGMWYGNINGVPTGLAACNGHLWKFYESEGYLDEPVDLGEFDTSRRVNFFAYSGIVYILNGDEYMQYDGVAFKAVTGYIPVVAVSRTPNGSDSTLLEEVNKLNNMRKVWFSPDGEDNVFLLPEKDILSVHYVKNLGTGEYINPSEYNVDRINGRVTFGKDEVIEYEEGVSTYTVTDADIDDVGSIEINGEVPTVTYLPDRSGVVFDEAPAYGSTITLESGTEFEEDITSVGDTTEYGLANKNMDSYVVSVDGDPLEPTSYFTNHFLPGADKSYIDLHYTPEIGDEIAIFSVEKAHLTKEVSFSSGNINKSVSFDWDGIYVADRDISVFNKTSGEDLPAIENVGVASHPFPEPFEFDQELFASKLKFEWNGAGFENNVGERSVGFYYKTANNGELVNSWCFAPTLFGKCDLPSDYGFAEFDYDHIITSNRYLGLWKRCFILKSGDTFITDFIDYNDGRGYRAIKSIPFVEYASYDIYNETYSGRVYFVEDIDYIVVSAEPYEDSSYPYAVKYTLDFSPAINRYGFYEPDMSSNVIALKLFQYRMTKGDHGVDPTYMEQYLRPCYANNELVPVDLSDYGITLPENYTPGDGDLISFNYIQNYWIDKGTFNDIYIKPHGQIVTATTKFDVTAILTTSDFPESWIRSARGIPYNPGPIAFSEANVPQMNRVYYLNAAQSSATPQLTTSEQITLYVYINGRRYYDSGDYVISGNLITFAKAPAEGALIHIDETHEPITKIFGADGEESEFHIGYVGAKEIAVTVDGINASLDKRFTFDPDTKTITILDTADMEDGDIITIKGAKPPARGINTIEICYSAGMAFTQTVNKMTNAEIFLGTQDNAVFLYGDGSNKAFYSGIDYNGTPRADYFPDLNEMAVADSNTPITGMIRHFSQLICYKSKSVYTIHYGMMSTAAGDAQYAFYITPVNKEIGNAALGQVRLVLNSPYALFGNDLYEWKSNSRYSSNLSQDERSAHRISDRIFSTLATFDAAECYCYDDNPGQEYYIWYDDKALVYNYAANAWYVYEGLHVESMCNLDNDLLLGTADGRILLMSEDYTNDDGEAFESYWESGSMDFGRDYMRKLMSEVWVSVKPEKDYSVSLTATTDKKIDFTEKTLSGISSDKDTPMVKKLKMKAKKFAYLKLILKTNDKDNGATILSIDPKVRETGYAK